MLRVLVFENVSWICVHTVKRLIFAGLNDKSTKICLYEICLIHENKSTWSFDNSFISTVSILKNSAFWFFIMNKGYWSFNDFIKSSSFCTIKTLDISNTDAKVKINQPKNSYSFIISKNKSRENLPKCGSENLIFQR